MLQLCPGQLRRRFSIRRAALYLAAAAVLVVAAAAALGAATARFNERAGKTRVCV